ncbi:RICIN domain-containing protein [Streptomyces sp. NPDC088921]|uniref:RICIN domain-containing protein n=1 Tax=unclassified Streptomyces TaxID=2593676 RepID=UPI0034426939
MSRARALRGLRAAPWLCSPYWPGVCPRPVPRSPYRPSARHRPPSCTWRRVRPRAGTAPSSSSSAGTPDIVQQAANGAAGSLWPPVQQSDGSFSFRNQNSGLCLDAYGGGSKLGP